MHIGWSGEDMASRLREARYGGRRKVAAGGLPAFGGAAGDQGFTTAE
jgi:hypothetical protein